MRFCKELQWKPMEVLLRKFKPQLERGVPKELLDLMRLKSLRESKARVLPAHV